MGDSKKKKEIIENMSLFRLLRRIITDRDIYLKETGSFLCEIMFVKMR